MAIRITCPGCQASLTLQDEMRGKKVRCRKCEQAINVPAANGVKKKEAAGVQASRNGKMKAAPAEEHEEEHEEETPKKKKKKSKKGTGLNWIVVGGLAGLFLVVIAGGVAAYVIMGVGRAPIGPVAKAPEEKEKDDRTPQRIVVPGIKEGNPANSKKGGTGIVNNVRGAAYRAERRSELKQIGLSFVQYADEYKGANRNLDTWLDYIKTYGPIRDAVKEGYYKMNFNARLEGSSVIAYERDIDKGAHLCVRGDGSVDYVPLAELKTILGRDP